ncbi:MAG: DNA-3-methyladenine glycosylase family protein [Leadbetterella sp.]
MENEQILAKADPILGKIIFQIPKPRIISTKDVFHDLISCIIEQQIHYRSTKKIFQKMILSADLTRLNTSNFVLFEEEALQSIKLSLQKYETIARVLEFWKFSDVDWLSLKDEEVITKLSSIKGIGPWTIDMILLYTLGRSNVFPSDDFHLKEIMVSEYSLDPKTKLKSQMLKISENWGDQKSLAVLYLLAYKQYLKKGKLRNT